MGAAGQGFPNEVPIANYNLHATATSNSNHRGAGFKN